jgi:metal-responsive CopG/Arc/MetJ family transcriptional regulator
VAVSKAATKVAVSIPDQLYRALERVRRARGKTRSAAVQEALRYWLDHEAERALVREYEAGYRRKPEGRREIKAAEAAAIRLLAAEDW